MQSHTVQADDKKFKEELGRVIEMDIWDAAKAVTTERLKGTRQQLGDLEAESRVRQELLASLQDQVSHSRCFCSQSFRSHSSFLVHEVTAEAICYCASSYWCDKHTLRKTMRLSRRSHSGTSFYPMYSYA